MGKKWTTEQRAIMKVKMVGKTPWNKGLKQKEVAPQRGFQKGHKPHNKGKSFKHSKSFKPGEDHHMFNGWSSYEPYTKDWTETLRISIRERGKYSCKVCGDKQGDETFHIHHIDYDKKNCNPDNLITLCNSCHMKTNFNRKFWQEKLKLCTSNC